MEIPTYILFLLGCLGATDIALFHSVAHGIRSHADSVGELVTHSLRGPTYAALFLFIPNFLMHGLFAWGLMALFVFDVGISIWDFSVEQGSRRFLGGLPSGEYVLHMLMAIIFGALVATFIYGANSWFTAPTRLIYAPAAVPELLRLVLAIMAICVLVSGIQDAAAVLRLKGLQRTEFSKIGGPPANLPSIAGVDSIEAKWRPDVGGVKGPLCVGWMQVVLVAAGLYNLLWGGWVMCFPTTLFRWAGMAAINYPQIWQCVGMLVGVYGFGYLIAARDPLCHWPIVAVGLLGKVIGPLGMCGSVALGGLPAGLAWICLTNDLIWWVPFAAILVRAFVTRRQAELGKHDRRTH